MEEEGKFQSLGRDSVGWDRGARPQTWGIGEVSIPRSGFCGVGRLLRIIYNLVVLRFNPSVGILWGGTRSKGKGKSKGKRFQSLGRDSVGWDDQVFHYVRGLRAVSIPRSGFCGVGPLRLLKEAQDWTVSIPRSGFCGVGPAHAAMDLHSPGGFNPSVGILWGGTQISLCCHGKDCRFQSLGRDSVGWDQGESGCHMPPGRFNPSVGILWGGTETRYVGSPHRLGFQSLGRDSVGWDSSHSSIRVGTFPVSIPRSGFCGVGRSMWAQVDGHVMVFQSLGRDSVGWDQPELAPYASAVGVSIPRSGFCGVGLSVREQGK